MLMLISRLGLLYDFFTKLSLLLKQHNYIFRLLKCIISSKLTTMWRSALQLGGFCLEVEFNWGGSGNKVHHPRVSRVTCHISHVMCHLSPVTYYVSHITWHQYSQTVRARDLTFWDNVHHPMRVICHISCVNWLMSHLTSHIGLVPKKNMYIFSCADKFLDLIGEGSV